MIKPQGPSGPGKEAAPNDVPATKSPSHAATHNPQKHPTSIPERTSDAGNKAQGHVVAKKTNGGERGRSGTQRPSGPGDPGDPGDGGEDEAEQEKAQHPKVS
jgi:hypothetical protein